MTYKQSGNNLCFCEYENIKGERSHLLATFCNCEVVDSICDDILGCNSISEEKVLDLIETLEDRMRLPYWGGAVRMKMTTILSFVLTPVLICVGAFGPYWTAISMALFGTSVYRALRWKRRSEFQARFTTSTLVAHSVVFMFVTVGMREILLWEIMVMITLFLATAFFFVLARRDPGYIFYGDHRNSDHVQHGASELEGSHVTWIDSRPIIDDILQLECSTCKIRRPPRSGHCSYCDRCVEGRDHHCIWLNTCIGQHNHKSFIGFIVLVFMTGCYGAHLTTTTVCTPEIYLDWFLFPSDCRFIYDDYLVGMSMASARIIIITLIPIALLILQQFIHIGQNVTSLEMVKARKLGHSRLFCIATKNINSRGFRKNWIDFLKGRRYQNACLPR